MQVQTILTETTFEARLSDRLSFSDNSAFRKLLDQAVASKRGHLVLNVAGLTSIDSAGLGMFIVAADTAKKAGLSFTLRGPSGHILKLIELSKLDKLIHVEF